MTNPRQDVFDRLQSNAKEGDLVLLVEDSRDNKERGQLFVFGCLTKEYPEAYEQLISIGEKRDEIEYYIGTKNLLGLSPAEVWVNPAIRIPKTTPTPNDCNLWCNPIEVYISPKEIVAGLISHEELAPYAGMFPSRFFL